MKPGDSAETSEFDRREALDWIQAQWVSNLAHDLSNPLFAVRGYLRLMMEQQGGPLTESQRRYLTVMLENIGTLIALTQELSEFPDPQTLDLACLNFRDLLQTALDEARPALAEKNVTLAQNLSSDKMTIIGDRVKLGRALRSFVSAVVRFTDPGGVIEAVAGEEDGKMSASLTAPRASSVAKGAPDVSDASKLWRLHGGRASVLLTEDHVLLVCELPVRRSAT